MSWTPSLSSLLGLIVVVHGRPLQGSITRVHGTSAAEDVKQGSLGDCWLIAALSCLADHPQKLKSLFASNHVTEEMQPFLPLLVDVVVLLRGYKKWWVASETI